MTLAEVQAGIKSVNALLDAALPVLGLEDLTALADDVSALAQKLASAIAGPSAAPLASEVAAADVAADIAEDAKFPKSP